MRGNVRGVDSTTFTLRLAICGDEADLPGGGGGAAAIFLFWRLGAHDEQQRLSVVTTH